MDDLCVEILFHGWLSSVFDRAHTNGAACTHTQYPGLHCNTTCLIGIPYAFMKCWLVGSGQAVMRPCVEVEMKIEFLVDNEHCQS